MKKLFLILIIVSLGWSLSAQEDTLSWKQQLQRHDIQIGIGDPLLPAFVTGQIFGHGRPDYYEQLPAVNWFGDDSYKWRACTPAISISYKYRLTKWFWLGATLSYTCFLENRYDRVTNVKTSSERDHIISIMPSVRFSWLNKKYVTLYSGLSLGYAVDIIQYKSQTEKYSTAEHGVGFQLTAVGVHVGRKWYGFTEIGIGMQGFIQAGFGCNFNSKKK
ncbi:MAG: hypothetical protein IKP54_11625 [Bacteroidales bacterium]|nr:hypothetical protein [Bacteroidales bacterium]